MIVGQNIIIVGPYTRALPESCKAVGLAQRVRGRRPTDENYR
jgi:hypothetical protein